MITLALDASTYVGTVAVFKDLRLLSQGSAAMRGREHELLMPAVEQALRDAGVRVGDLTRVVCGAGPGSFTSLRVAASIAKGLAVGRGLPLYGVSSLALIVAANAADSRSGERFTSRLDALRGESYVAGFERRADLVIQTRALELVRDGDVTRWSEGSRIVGPDEQDPWNPHVRGLPLLGPRVFDQPVNLAAWEPVYGRLAEAQVKWEATHGRALQP